MRSTIWTFLVALAVAPAPLSVAAREVTPEAREAMGLFSAACLEGEMAYTPQRAQAVASGWQPVEGASLSDLGVGDRTVAQPAKSAVFKRPIAQGEARLYLADLTGDAKLRGYCAVTVPFDGKNFLSSGYGDIFYPALRAHGVRAPTRIDGNGYWSKVTFKDGRSGRAEAQMMNVEGRDGAIAKISLAY